MIKVKQKVSYVLIFVFLASLLLPTMGLAAEANDAVVSVELNNVVSGQTNQERLVKQLPQDNLINSNEETIEPNGLPRWLTKKIVQAVADGIRIGINSKYVKKMVGDYFNEEMEEAFFKYANKIADKLDYFVEIDELATDYVKNELYKLLYKLTGDAGVSLGIADGIVSVISFFM